MKRNPIDWSQVEDRLGFTINDNYKEFYETLGSIVLDDFLYIVGLDEKYGLLQHVEYTLDAYGELKEFIDEDIEVITKWLPVGYTIDSTFIFCDENSVMLTDGGFENIEIYEMSLFNFIVAITENKITSENLIEDLNEIEHNVRILDKR